MLNNALLLIVASWKIHRRDIISTVINYRKFALVNLGGKTK